MLICTATLKTYLYPENIIDQKKNIFVIRVNDKKRLNSHSKLNVFTIGADYFERLIVVPWPRSAPPVSPPPNKIVHTVVTI